MAEIKINITVGMAPLDKIYATIFYLLAKYKNLYFIHVYLLITITSLEESRRTVDRTGSELALYFL
jgi:hypothetical protein